MTLAKRMLSVRRPWAWPLVPLYAAAQSGEARLRAAGVLPARRLGCPVLSVGSLSAGGAGKTPVVLALARLLGERGWLPDILSRGYGRTGSGIARVDPAAPAAASLYGDEPVLLAGRSGAPVWVGPDRYAAGLAAEAAEPLPGQATLWPSSPRRVHLLDDGFQHRALARDFDLVVLTAEDLQEALLPAGNRREPLRALGRADAVVLREDEADALAEPLRALLREGTPLWTLRRQLRFPPVLGVFAAGLRPLAFCALARPENFVAMLSAAGCGVIDAVTFRDHARYGDGELDQIIHFARELRATGLVTTEKDAVKLDGAGRRRLQDEVGPLMVVELEAEFVYTSPVLRTLEACLNAARSQATPAEPVA